MIEVLREGEPTVDGRFINHGAMTLPSDPVPLFDWDANEDKNELSPVGALFNFHRGQDDRIYCESSLEDERTVTVTVAIDEQEIVGGESVGVSKGRILGGVIGKSMDYPWKQDT